MNNRIEYYSKSKVTEGGYMQNIVLEVSNFKKNYGKFEAVKGISFEVSQGEIFALIGPNGAGKTSTLRSVATVLKPTMGDIKIMGKSVNKYPQDIRQIISYLPEESGAYKQMTGIDYLNFMANIFSANPKIQKDYVQTAIEICGLGDRLKDKMASYSKGMTRKLLLARAVMTRPKLAILDEPTSGLDVINAIEVRNVIKRLADNGMAVLISSHNMFEIEFLSDKVAIMDRGLIHLIGTPAELKLKTNSQNLEEVFAGVSNR